jgi:hypothetical protein
MRMHLINFLLCTIVHFGASANFYFKKNDMFCDGQKCVMFHYLIIVLSFLSLNRHTEQRTDLYVLRISPHFFFL